MRSKWFYHASALLATMLVVLPARAAEAELGDFEAQADVGTVEPAGAAEFDKTAKQYRIKSSGANIWNKHDDFHFVYRTAPADITLTADVALVGQGKNAHRKAGLMIRQGLEPDAAYVDVMVHGDGMIALQYRKGRGEVTLDLKSTVKAPATVRLERRGDTFTAYAAPATGKDDKPPAGEQFKSIGSVKVPMTAPACAGLAVTAHNATATETATFSRVAVESAAAAAKPVP